MMAYQSISRWSGALSVCAIIAIIRPAHADPRAVVELFTSQGCSACPPADKILGELAKDPNRHRAEHADRLLGLSRLEGYAGDSRFSARQKAYSHMRGDRDVYTPQVIVNGSAHVIGSDRDGIEGAINTTHNANGVMSVPVTMTLSGKQINVSVAASKVPAATHGEVWICSVSKAVPISIGRGENRGRELTYYNVVRNILKVGDWNGSSGSWTVPLENISRDGVDARRGLRPGRQSRKAGPDARRGLHAAAVIIPAKQTVLIIPGCAVRRRPIITMVVMDSVQLHIKARAARAPGMTSAVVRKQIPKKEKGPTRVGPVLGITPPANRPDPDGPGGLGAEESGTERTGSTQ